MATGGKRRKQKGKGTKRRLWILLTVSVLFLICLFTDLKRRGLLEEKEIKLETLQKEKTGKEAKEKNIDEENIRILLTDSSMTELFHSSVEITGSGRWTIKSGKESKSYAAGKAKTFSLQDVKAAGKTLTVTCPEGRLKVNSITRSGHTPSYRGSLKLIWNRKGILLVNELAMREYLYAVVPSEMPASYPLEALKAQAVCARSFAWRQMKSGSYKKYGADVDDTTSFQVYNTVGENKRSRQAVNRTAGEMVYCEGEVITTYYYSTSWGCSATEKEVWGGESSGFYPCALQITEKSGKETGYKTLDLSDETVFYSFLTQSLCQTYDSGSEWYRWNITLSAKQLGARLGIGKVKKILVLKRGKSGILQKLRVIGTKGRLTLEGQEQIRQQLMVPGTKITREEQGDSSYLSILPSAAFLIYDGMEDGEVVFTLLGGGLGHGVGMSQNGASGMAEEGKNYRQILKHYYKNCEIR